MSLMDEVAERKRALDSARPLARPVVERLSDWYEVELTVTRLALEDRRISREEARSLFDGERATANGPTPSDRRFALNHRRLLELSARLTTRGGAVSDRTACAFHGTLTREIDPAAGRLREGDLVDDWGVPAPDAAKVKVSVAAFNAWSRRAENGFDAAFEAHTRLLSIRPLTSANTAVALSIADLILARAGFPPIVVREDDATTYRETARRFLVSGDRGRLRDFFATILRRELDRCLVAAAEAAALAVSPFAPG